MERFFCDCILNDVIKTDEDVQILEKEQTDEAGLAFLKNLQSVIRNWHPCMLAFPYLLWLLFQHLVKCVPADGDSYTLVMGNTC